MKTKITKRSVEAPPHPEGRPVFLWDTEIAGFGCKVLSRAKVYIFQYRPHPGGRNIPKKRITIGKHGELTADQARRIATDLLLEVRSGGDPQKVREEKKEGEMLPTMADLGERFLDEYLPGKKRPPRANTLYDYRGVFRVHLIPRFGKRPVADITTADVEALHASMRAKPYQANRVLSVLHQAMNQAERWEWRPQGSNPTVHIERYREARRGAKKEVMLTSSQMADLLSAIEEEEERATNPTACAAIRVAFWTGWRISEVLRLEWANVALESGEAKLIQTKTADEERRQLPYEAVKVIERQPRIAGSPYVFPGKIFGTPLTTVRGSWQIIRRRARLDQLDGLGAFRLHDLRHNVVSWDVSRGVALEIAGKNVGHRSRQSTEVYAHFAPDALKRAADERARAMREAMEGGTSSTPPR